MIPVTFAFTAFARATRAENAGRNVDRVIAVYEAGWSGFWLVRWLARYGIETHVIQPSSSAARVKAGGRPATRAGQRRKTDCSCVVL